MFFLGAAWREPLNVPGSTYHRKANRQMTTIAIVGAGFSGTLLTLHLLRCCPPSVKLILIERTGRFGPGLAYSTGNAGHILNVPAGRMSAFHDRPDDFLTWLRGQSATGATPEAFVPRRVFGTYVRSLLNDAVKRSEPGRLALVRGAVTAIDTASRPLALTLDRGRRVTADFVVLAAGNFPPEALPVATPAFYDSPGYRPDPWSPTALSGLKSDDAVLLIGTGLTTVDIAISLLDRGHTGPIHALSRRGLLPQRHAALPRPSPLHAPFPTSLTALTRFLRQEVRRASAEGSGWQPVVDELRPFTVDIWQSLSFPDRKRFLRHARPWWDTHRHRMAGSVADRIDAARAGGQLRISAGRVREYVTGEDRIEVRFRPRGEEMLRSLHVARVVNCSGSLTDFDRIQDPLMRSLLADGAVRPDPLRLGLDVSASCAMFDRTGALSRRLFAVGPITKGTFWEMTAVPDIRRQAGQLAEHLSVLARLVG